MKRCGDGNEEMVGRGSQERYYCLTKGCSILSGDDIHATLPKEKK